MTYDLSWEMHIYTHLRRKSEPDDMRKFLKRYAPPEVEFYSIADGDQLKKNAYDEGVRAMNNAWKNKPKKEQKEPSDREWEISGPLSDSEGAELKEQAWRDSVEELQNA